MNTSKLYAGILTIVIMFVAIPYTHAETLTATPHARVVSIHAPKKSTATTTRALTASSTREIRIQNEKEKGDTEISDRITSINQLIVRMQNLKNVSDTDRTSLIATLQAHLTILTQLKTKLASDTSTTTVAADVKAITADTRIYALIIPRAYIVATADQVTTVVQMMRVAGSKLSSRLASSTSITQTPEMQSAMYDFDSKLTDALQQARLAVSSTENLIPDGGDATKLAANTAALKAAKINLQTAQQDIVAARKDLTVITTAVKTGHVSTPATVIPKGSHKKSTTATSTTR